MPSTTEQLFAWDQGIEGQSPPHLISSHVDVKEGKKKGNYHLFHSWLRKASTIVMAIAALMVQGTKDHERF